MIPTQLNEIAEFLKTNPYNLSQPLQDGRLNPSVNEEEILNTIKHFFLSNCQKPESGGILVLKKTIFFILLILKSPPQKPLTILIVN